MYIIHLDPRIIVVSLAQIVVETKEVSRKICIPKVTHTSDFFVIFLICFFFRNITRLRNIKFISKTKLFRCKKLQQFSIKTKDIRISQELY